MLGMPNNCGKTKALKNDNYVPTCPCKHHEQVALAPPHMPESIEDMPEIISERMPEDTAQNMSEDKPEKCQTIYEDMPERMPK